MTCNTPCARCTCEPTSIYNHDYIEADASPMATPATQVARNLLPPSLIAFVLLSLAQSSAAPTSST